LHFSRLIHRAALDKKRVERAAGTVSGTGTYANATGTGSFDGVPAAFKDASLLNGKFNVKTP
jgi:hypothetical protein